MIIGDDFVYIHVPKTGGSSFEKMMRERHDLHVQGDQHDTAADIPEEHRDKFIFGFLRDPIGAERSNWRYHRGSWHSPEMTFEGWCEWRYGDKGVEYGDTTLKLKEIEVEYGYIFNTRPSVGLLCGADGQCVVDRIFRFENLTESTEILSDTLGIDCSLEGYHALKSQVDVFEGDEVTPRCEELIRKAKGIDFTVHGEPGEISTEFHCPTAPNYCYTRDS